jgi:D-alanine-D-alanine ligase
MKVLVLMGGPSHEHDISIKSGKNVCIALISKGFHVLPCIISKENLWISSENLIDNLNGFEKFLENLISGTTPEETVLKLKKLNIEACFPVLHGPYGEDGKIQGFLEVVGIPYVGSSVLGSALSMDKLVSKYILRGLNLPTPEFLEMDEPDYKRVLKHFKLPVVLKAPSQGSSFGIVIVKDEKLLESSLKQVLEFENRVLVEQFISGRELTCGVLRKNNELKALPVTEIIPKVSTYFDFEAKYKIGGSDEITPADISDDLKMKVQKLAVKTHKAFRLGSLSRTDFLIDHEENPYILESNSIPGFTETSLYPQAAQAENISFGDLLELMFNEIVH